MKVSIVIPTYNNLEYLPETIESCLAQTYKDFEIILVDDASTEDIYSYVKNIPKITYIRNEKNMGPGYSRNVGVEASSGELISLIDSDDIMHKDKLTNSVGKFSSDIGLICGDYCIFVNRIMRSNPRPFYGFGREMDIGWNSMIKVNYVACGSTTFRKDVFNEVGGFNETYWVAEDYDLWLRISEKYRIRFIPKVMYYYSRIQNGNSLVNRNERNEFPDYRKEIISNSIERMKGLK
ncbi:glycosyltransferase [bacterium]|nr:glycosyltransferase [bacterium]